MQTIAKNCQKIAKNCPKIAKNCPKIAKNCPKIAKNKNKLTFDRFTASVPPPASTALAAHHSGDVAKKSSMPPCEPPALGSQRAVRSNAFETATAPGTPLRTARHACHSGAPATSTPPPSDTSLRSLTSGNVWKDSIDAAISVRSFEAPVSAASSAFQSDPASVFFSESFFENPAPYLYIFNGRVYNSLSYILIYSLYT